MKILLATSSLDTGGAETHVLSLALALAEGGDRVTVVSSGGRMVQELKRRGITHLRIPLHDRRLPALLSAGLALRRLLRKEVFDLIHAHARIPAFLLSSLARQKRIPLVTTVHARFQNDTVSRMLSRWGEKSIAVSEDLRQYLAKEYAIPPSRVEVIPNGVDTKRFSPKKSNRADRLRLTFVSRLDFDCSDVAYALCRLAKQLELAIPRVEILLCGGGEAYFSLCRMAEGVNEEIGKQAVRVLGRVEEMSELLCSSDLVCGVSRVAMEAMACGVPVILGGNEGFFGLLTPSDFDRMSASNFCCRGEARLSDARLYRSILQAASLSSQERQDLGQALRHLVCDRADISKVAERTRCLYRETLEEYGRRGEDILLCGYYGFGNLGDEALLRAAVLRARQEYPKEKIAALTAHGKRDEAFFGIRCFNRHNPFALRRSISHAKHFIFGGGTLLQDGSSLRSLLFYTSLLRFAAKQGADCRLWGNGIGPLYRELGRRQAAKALRCCSRIECRDRLSLTGARELLEKEGAEKLSLVSDLAEQTVPCDSVRVDFLLHNLFGANAPPFAVVAVRGKEGKGYQKAMAEWLSTLRGQGVELVFVSMFPREDRALTERLCRELTGKLLTGVDERDLVALMARAEIVCGMRLHALVLASVAKTPFVGFGGEDKVRSFCRERGGVYFTELYQSK